MTKSGRRRGSSNPDIRIEVYEDTRSRLHDYGLTNATWRRAMRIMQQYGDETALSLLDERAERALIKGNLSVCVRWRDLMAAIHALVESEPKSTDRVH